MSNHTPGPWKILTYDWGDRFGGVKPFTDPFGKYAIKGKTEEPIIASVSGFANARLIAASPELKDIVKEFVEKAVIPIRPPERDPLGEVMAVLVQQWVDDDLLNRAQSLLRWIEGEEAREA